MDYPLLPNDYPEYTELSKVLEKINDLRADLQKQSKQENDAQSCIDEYIKGIKKLKSLPNTEETLVQFVKKHSEDNTLPHSAPGNTNPIQVYAISTSKSTALYQVSDVLQWKLTEEGEKEPETPSEPTPVFYSTIWWKSVEDAKAHWKNGVYSTTGFLVQLKSPTEDEVDKYIRILDVFPYVEASWKVRIEKLRQEKAAYAEATKALKRELEDEKAHITIIYEEAYDRLLEEERERERKEAEERRKREEERIAKVKAAQEAAKTAQKRINENIGELRSQLEWRIEMPTLPTDRMYQLFDGKLMEIAIANFACRKDYDWRINNCGTKYKYRPEHVRPDLYLVDRFGLLQAYCQNSKCPKRSWCPAGKLSMARWRTPEQLKNISKYAERNPYSFEVDYSQVKAFSDKLPSEQMQMEIAKHMETKRDMLLTA